MSKQLSSHRDDREESSLLIVVIYMWHKSLIFQWNYHQGKMHKLKYRMYTYDEFWQELLKLVCNG